MTDVSATRDRFFDGRNAVRRAVAPLLVGRTLSINDPEGRAVARWDLDDMVLIERDAAHGSMVFTIASDPKPRLVLFQSPQRTALLTAKPRLRHEQRRRPRRGLVRAIILLLLIAAIAALVYFGRRDGSAWIAQVLPRSWDDTLGDRLHEAMLDRLDVCDAADGKAALYALGRKLLPENPTQSPLTIDVVRAKPVNAFALPGNHILVFSGLIDRAADPDALAAALAHEIAHLELRDPTQSVIDHLGPLAVARLIRGGDAPGDIASLTHAIAYTPAMERAADARATALLQRARIRNVGLAAFSGSTFDASGPLPDWPTTHGASEVAAARAESTSEAPILAAEAWEAVKGICNLP